MDRTKLFENMMHGTYNQWHYRDQVSLKNAIISEVLITAGFSILILRKFQC